jgi:hypothetical protein
LDFRGDRHDECNRLVGRTIDLYPCPFHTLRENKIKKKVNFLDSGQRFPHRVVSSANMQSLVPISDRKLLEHLPPARGRNNSPHLVHFCQKSRHLAFPLIVPQHGPHKANHEQGPTGGRKAGRAKIVMVYNC